MWEEINMRNSQYAFLSILLILMLTLLTGCSESAKDEKEIIQDLQSNSAFIANDIKISNYEIIKRQTDVNNKTDLVYITVQTNDPELTCSLSYELRYKLYNDGWILESMVRYYDGPWEFSGLTNDQILSDIKSNDYYFENWDLDIQNIEVTSEVYNSNAMAYYEKEIVVDLTAHNMLFDYFTSYSIYYEVANGEWELKSVDVQSRQYVPTSSPDIRATDSIIDTLELGEGATATKYDSYRYLESDADWPNCTEIRYYMATKDWWFGTESYLISIPLSFSLESGEDSSMWTYNSSEIETSIHEVDWKITGIWNGTWLDWEGNVDPQYGEVTLNINSITGPNDTGTFSANLSCDADCGQKYRFYCKTRGTVDAKLVYSDPGYYRLFVDNPTKGQDDAWRGTFKLVGYSVGGTSEGFFWEYSRIGASTSDWKLSKVT